MTSRIFRWLIGAVIIALIGVKLSVFTVREGDVAVVARFGQVRRVIKEPGWYGKMLWPVDVAHRLDIRKRVFSPTFTETLTRDQRNIIVWSYVVWSIDTADQQPDRFVESFKATRVGAERAVEDAESRLNGLILDAQNDRLGFYDLQQLVSTDPRELKITRIEEEVTQTVQARAKDLGIVLHQFGFKRLALPESTVKKALERMAIKRQAVANRYRGEGERAAREIRSATELEVTRIRAKAEKEAAEIRGRAEAERANILLEAHSLDPEFYAWLRSLEALKRMLTPVSTVILDTRSPPWAVLKEPTGPTATSPSAASAAGESGPDQASSGPSGEGGSP